MKISKVPWDVDVAGYEESIYVKQTTKKDFVPILLESLFSFNRSARFQPGNVCL